MNKYMKEKRRLLEDRAAASIIKQLLEALDYLHSCGVVHRDVKLENMLFVDKTYKRLKLADFGFAEYEDRMDKDVVGTPATQSPEVLRGEGCSTSADMWAVGAETYTLLMGRRPKYGRADIDELVLRSGKLWLHKTFAALDEDAQDFVRKLTTAEPGERLSASAALAHPWIQKNAEATEQPAQMMNQVVCSGSYDGS